MIVSKGWRAVGILLFGVQMAACGPIFDALPGAGGDKRGSNSTNNLAPPAPIGTLSGVAKDALVQNASVNVYAWNGSKGELLGSGVTDDRGRYSLQLQVRSQSVLLEVTGGRYNEEATGRAVDVGDDALFAVQNYTRGQTLTTAITYYTTLATGLAEHLVRLGMKPSDAVQEANGRLSAILGIDTITVMPTDVVNPGNLSFPELRYGIATAALSSLTERASSLNGSEPHAIFTSIRFIQEAYDDVRADGVLNGRGLNGEVAFGRVRLTAEIYRHELALHILRIANNKEANRTGLGPAEVFDLALRLNGSTDPIFGGAPVIPIDRNKPNVTALMAREFPSLANGTVVFGGLNLTAMVVSFPGASSAELILDDDSVIGTAVDPENPLVFLDTFSFPIAEGQHTLKLRVTDISGAMGESPSLSVTVSNRQTAIENVTIAGAIVGKPVSVTANIADPAGIASVVFSVKAGDGTFVPVATPDVPPGEMMIPVSARFDPRRATFADGAATFRVEVTNSVGFTFSQSVPFTIDTQPPVVTIVTPIETETNRDGSQGRYYNSQVGMPCAPRQPGDPNDLCVLYARKPFNLQTTISDEIAIDSVDLFVAGSSLATIRPSDDPKAFSPSFTLDPSNFAVGKQMVTVMATDKAHNDSADSRPVVFDPVPPTVTGPRVLAVNQSGNGIKGDFEITADSSDTQGIASARLLLDGQVLDRRTNLLDQSIQLSAVATATGPDGPRAITVETEDFAGNLTRKTQVVDYDNTGPVFEIRRIIPLLQNPGIGRCQVDGRIVDPHGSTITMQRLTIVDNPTPELFFSQDGERFSADVRLNTNRLTFKSSEVTLELQAEDDLGNTTPFVLRFNGFVDREESSRFITNCDGAILDEDGNATNEKYFMQLAIEP